MDMDTPPTPHRPPTTFDQLAQRLSVAGHHGDTMDATRAIRQHVLVLIRESFRDGDLCGRLSKLVPEIMEKPLADLTEEEQATILGAGFAPLFMEPL